MNKNDLLTIAEREQQRLSDENDHSAAAIMRALIERVRGDRADLRSNWSKPVLVDVEAVRRALEAANHTTGAFRSNARRMA